MNNNVIRKFFYPESICVVGASSKEKSIGYELLNTIKKYNYQGVVLPVNPKSSEVLGYNCFKSIEEIDKPIDLAILVVPKQFVEISINQLITKDVKSYIVITAGFKETGDEGAKVEIEIVNKIKAIGGRMVGPNCMGVISSLDEVRLNATFVAEEPEKGRTGFLSQSGALGAAVLNSLRETDIKFAHFISVGNKADINENDILEFWENDDNISVMTFYLESFVDGAKFVKPVFENNISKPIIVLKAGKTEGGMKAASSHTGALGSSDKVVESLLDQAGIIRADDLNELFNTAKGFENFPLPIGKRIAVVTNAGGPAILAVDALEGNGLKLAELSESTKESLREIVLPEASVNNPVDLLPGANAELYKQVNELVAIDKNVDAVVSIFVEPVMVQPLSVVEGISSIDSDKPILQVVMPLPEFWENYRKNSEKKLPLFRNPEDPAKVLANMFFYQSKQIQNIQKIKLLENKGNLNSFNFSDGFLKPKDIQKLVEQYNIPRVQEIILSKKELTDLSDDHYPIVLKGLNKAIIHKSEFDAVKLNIKNQNELIKAIAEIENSFKDKGFDPEEFMVQPFINTKHEILIGGFRDPSFGPILMFGTGGKYVEVIKDTKMKSAYLSDLDIDDMINDTKMGEILHGVRGEAAIDLSVIKQTIKNCAKMMLENPQISEFDLNPVLIDQQNKTYCVDIRINWSND